MWGVGHRLPHKVRVAGERRLRRTGYRGAGGYLFLRLSRSPSSPISPPTPHLRARATPHTPYESVSRSNNE